MIEIVEQLNLIGIPSNGPVRVGYVRFVKQFAVIQRCYRLTVRQSQMLEVAVQKAGVRRRFANLQFGARIVVDVADTHLVAYAVAAQRNVGSIERGVNTVINQCIAGQHRDRSIK